MSPYAGSGSDRELDATLPAAQVLAELQQRRPPALLVRWQRDGQDYHCRVAVDDELLRRLERAAAAGFTLGQLLDVRRLQAQPSPPAVAIEIAVPKGLAARVLEGLPNLPPELGLLTHAQRTSLFDKKYGAPPALRAETRELFPEVTPLGDATAAPGKTLQYLLRFAGVPPALVTALLGLDFPDGVEQIALVAQVSSRDFAPAGAWMQTFTVDRQLRVSPPDWSFAATVVDAARPRYALTVTFHAGAAAGAAFLGALQVSAAAAGAPPVAPPPRRSLTVPLRWNVPALMTIAERPNDEYSFALQRHGEQLATDVAWATASDAFFRALDQARDLAALERLGYDLAASLPYEVRQFLDEETDDPLLIVSNGRVAPFEALKLRIGAGGPFLGVARPVARWVHEPMPERDLLEVRALGCLRPSYADPADRLPAAEREQRNLEARFAQAVVSLGRCSALPTLLANGAVGLVHFAGHAQGEPAGLMMEDDALTPTAFTPSSALIAQGHPLFFLNACRAGQGRANAPAALGNYARALLAFRASGVIAPMLSIDSQAALAAAQCFYDAAGAVTVAAAVRQVRELALRTEHEEWRATFLGYASFMAPSLQLRLPAVAH